MEGGDSRAVVSKYRNWLVSCPKLKTGILASVNWLRGFNKEPKPFTGIKTHFSLIRGFSNIIMNFL